MKKVYLLGVAAFSLLASSCATIPTSVGIAALYTNVTEGAVATSNRVGSKVGTAHATNVFGLVAVGNASINSAAREAGITKISHVDVQKSNILGLISTTTIYVYGE